MRQDSITRKLPLLGLIPCALVLLCSFQNCGRFSRSASTMISAASHGQNGRIGNKSIWSLNKTYFANHPMIFYINPKLFGSQATLGWFYELNGGHTGCSVKPHGRYENVVAINCDSAGVLLLTLLVIETDGKTERIYFNLVIGATGAEEVVEEDRLYFAPAEVALNFDGSPGPAYRGPLPIDDTPAAILASPGQTLYQVKCSQCHGDLRSSRKLGRSALEIRDAITRVSSMSHLSELSVKDIDLIADSL